MNSNHEQFPHGPYTQACQEADLDDVHAGASRLNQHARTMHSEMVGQNDLLDCMASDIEGGTYALQKETAKAQLVNANKGKLCKLYVTIAVLVVALVLITKYFPTIPR
ncbi:Aste57867_10652 [Aphanomyces stellatus]|uniref:Aste57867_10652 protein n=1 Tax=Aphanomyces stellatus TaxID=120398 RepID=A0A485KSH8_9STRA|nr:hypothetical protein As57867_010612 [Aphanomyces stellatus]VFT87524.1 Aste57867_10652 [Aphanomyces stellatus]